MVDSDKTKNYHVCVSGQNLYDYPHHQFMAVIMCLLIINKQKKKKLKTCVGNRKCLLELEKIVHSIGWKQNKKKN